MSLVVTLMGITVLSSVGLTVYYFLTDNAALGVAYSGVAILYIGLIAHEYS